MSGAAASSTDVRDELHRLLAADLVGPWDGPDETVVGNPRGRYLAGALAPVKVDPTVATDSETAPPAAQERLDDLRAGDQALLTPCDPSSGGVPEADDFEVTETDDPEEADDKGPASKLIAPSSMGLRFRIATPGPSLAFTARWGAYSPRREADDDGRIRTHYDRTPHEHTVVLDADRLLPGADLDLRLLEANGSVEVALGVEVLADGDGTSIVEVALQNRRVTDGTLPPRQWLFQAELEVAGADGSAMFLPIQDPLVALPSGLDEEEARLELLYRDRLEFAVGRTCSATWTTVDPTAEGVWRQDLTPGSRAAFRVRTTWIPQAEVPQTVASGVEGVLLSMARLATASRSEVVEGLAPLITGYRGWLTERRTDAVDLPDHLRTIAQDAIEDAGVTADRLQEGLDLLAADEDAFRAFRFMNRVMADQRVHSQVAQARSEDPTLSSVDALARVIADGERAASWRHFQIGFILMQLPSLTDPTAMRRSSDAARAELLFFPTGGGKTEAYLGLAAYTFAIRRLQGVVDSPDGPLDGGDGVAVLMRYTLRLLTTQQFQRATTLVCAAELARREDPDTWGAEPFRIGLWVGSNVSPKSYDEAEEQIKAALATEGRPYGITVLQLQRCPWCGTPISPQQHITLDRKRRRVLVRCGARLGTECPFAEGGTVDDGLPVLTVDEEIYRHPPTYLLATVDKFARISREGQAASLFGYVAERCPRHGYRHPDTPTAVCSGSSHRAAGNLPAVTIQPAGRLRPPDLVIQDELHLITGALGTAVGLFEVAVDTLCSWRRGADAATASPVHPLVVASTATSRNAEAQVRRLYGRGIEIFPPRVLDVSDTYFSREEPVTAEHPGRRYLGVCAHGAKLTLTEIRVSEILLLAGQKLLDAHGAAADPYLTLVGYFSATRELAGMRRYLDDDVATRITNPDKDSGYPRRGTWGLEIGELTSRVSSTDITKTLDRLAVPFDPEWDSTQAHRRNAALRRADKPVPRRAGERPYDVVLATSMLQVGVDVGRLGLMLVVGQPKNTAEYIQASSRVGREAHKPGLVVTLANRSRPRDMAHYEQFEHYHRTFYAHVEALSVTPYSDSSLERGLTGVLVAIARVLDVGRPQSYSPQPGAWSITSRYSALQHFVDVIAHRAAASGADDKVQEIKDKLTRRLDTWYAKARAVPAISYSGTGPTLLKSPEDGEIRGEDVYLRVANSMREVQPEISLILRTYGDQVAEPDPVDAPGWVFAAEVGS